MAGLKDKLRKIDPARKKSRTGGKDFSVNIVKRKQPVRLIINGGEEIQNERGSFLSFKRRFSCEVVHGGRKLGNVLNYSGRIFALAGSDPALKDLEPERTIFLDTETTGLAGGPGTFVFLAGAGFFRGGYFHLQQFFMRDYDEEQALLHHLQGMLNEFSAIVTFNGKCFDWPLIKDKLIYSKINSNPCDPLHLDLLHSSRRIWRERLISCSLNNIEREVLGFCREGDIPGERIPEEYFRFLRERDLSGIKLILKHNLLDILSLVSLLDKLCQIYQDRGSCLNNSADLFALARTFERQGMIKDCVCCYLRALKMGLPDRLEKKALLNLSMVFKKEGNWAGALKIWEKLIESGGQGAIVSLIEIAKYLEHQKKDFKGALKAAEKAREIMIKNRPIINFFARGMAEIDKRIARLLKKIDKEMRAPG